ncbi:DUF1638 domain-containing protein [Desulfotomaculum copahuensis]|uniref:DUF1638 domain-containing protein n=1 Tax=Desulfotomaculum copahuensis TaxID=1838280 RepID=A0A1B7LEV5_9FIRM|nr:DUF1638 domain-containing protein [Desulfotomaculum copahuensis]OAT81830.1 hypothetical protein A6M21_09790 [Desulfotomaculum copahuensis]
MSADVSFKEYAIVACGTMSPELNHLAETGFLDAAKIIYTAPGLHQKPLELEKQLLKQLSEAKKYARKIIIVYGGTYCYINVREPLRTIDTVIDGMREEGYYIARTIVHNCVDMVASTEERDEIAAGGKIWFCTPGWLKYRNNVFEGWDKAHANENFPQYTGGAVMLDGVGLFNRYMEEKVEEILDFSDWMGIPLEARDVSLERFKNVLIAAMAEEDKPVS